MSDRRERPPTLASPLEPGRPPVGPGHAAPDVPSTLQMGPPSSTGFDIDGATIAQGPPAYVEETLHDPQSVREGARSLPRPLSAHAPGTQRAAPATMLSNIAASTTPANPGAIAPEDAVVDVGAPAYAYVARPNAPPFAGYGPPGGGPPPGYVAPTAMMHPVHGQAPPGMVAQVAQVAQRPREASTRTLVLVVIGAVLVGVIAVGGAIAFFLYFSSQRAPVAASAPAASHGPAVAATATAAQAATPPAVAGGVPQERAKGR